MATVASSFLKLQNTSLN